MRNFCEYLMERGLVAEKAMLVAMASQIEEAPTLAEMIHYQNLTTEENQIAAHKAQLKLNTTFSEAMVGLGLLTPAFHSKIEEAKIFFAKNIYQVLVEQDLLSVENLLEQFDEFISEICEGELVLNNSPQTRPRQKPSDTSVRDHQDESPNRPAESVMTTPMLDQDNQQRLQLVNDQPRRAFPLEVDFTFPDRDPLKVVEFTKLLSKSFKLSLTDKINRMFVEEDFTTVKSLVGLIVEEYQPILKAAIDLNLEVTPRLIQTIISVNDYLCQRPSLSRTLIEKIADLNRSGLTDLYFLKVFMELSKSEETYWLAESRKSQFLQFIEKVRGTII